MKPPKASEVIRETRNVLFERGWASETWQDEEGHVCLVSALSLAATGRVVRRLPVTTPPLRPVLAEALRMDTKVSFPRWNDWKHRTFTHVIDALDRAEKIAERDEAALLAPRSLPGLGESD